MGHEGGSTPSAGPSTIPAFGGSPVPSVSQCLSRAPIFPAGKHISGTSNHAGGGLGDNSVEAGINLEMDEGKDALLSPSPALAPGCSGTNELPRLENPVFGGLMAQTCTVLI